MVSFRPIGLGRITNSHQFLKKYFEDGCHKPSMPDEMPRVVTTHLDIGKKKTIINLLPCLIVHLNSSDFVRRSSPTNITIDRDKYSIDWKQTKNNVKFLN